MKRSSYLQRKPTSATSKAPAAHTARGGQPSAATPAPWLFGANPRPEQLLETQRTVGNRQVQRLLNVTLTPAAAPAGPLAAALIQRVLNVAVHGGNARGYRISATGRPNWYPQTMQALYNHLRERNHPQLNAAMNPNGTMKPGWSRAHVSDWKTVRTALINPYQNLNDGMWQDVFAKEEWTPAIGRLMQDEIRVFIEHKLTREFNRTDEEALDNISINLTAQDRASGDAAEHLEQDILANHSRTQLERMARGPAKDAIVNKIRDWIQEKLFLDSSWSEQEIYDAKKRHLDLIQTVYGSEVTALGEHRIDFKGWLGKDPKVVAQAQEQRREKKKERKRAEQEQLKQQQREDERTAREQQEQAAIAKAKRTEEYRQQQREAAARLRAQTQLRPAAPPPAAQQVSPAWMIGVIALLLAMAAAWYFTRAKPPQ